MFRIRFIKKISTFSGNIQGSLLANLALYKINYIAKGYKS